MARNDSRRFNPPFADRAAPRSRAAASWPSFANLMVASALVVAVVVSALALFEAALSPSASKLVRQSPQPGLQYSYVGARPHADSPTNAMQPEAVLFVHE
jgi:hypothetical protein